MEQKEIKKLFPLSVVVPENINFSKNIGEQLLKSNLSGDLVPDIFWGLSIGNVRGVLIKTEKCLDWPNEGQIIPLYLQKGEVEVGDTIVFKLRE